MNVIIEKAIKSYGDKIALDINKFKFNDGNIYAVLGLNGSGKTTLLECIGGLNSLSRGRINYEDNLHLDSVNLHISIMTQKPYLFNDTVINNISSGLRFRKFHKDEITERVNKYLDYFDLKELLYKNAKTLSGGESAKTAMLRTAVLETRLILLDEPTSSMDIESTLNAERLIRDMAKDGRTIIVITHDLYQAQRIADFVIFMDRGRIIESGDKLKVLNNPENKLVRLILNR